MDIPAEGFIPKDLDKLKIKDHKNNIVAQVGMMFTLYIENPHEKEVKFAVGECIEEYIALMKPYLKRYGGELGIKQFSKTPIQPLSEMIEPLDKLDAFEFAATGSETDAQSSPYNVKTLLPGKRGDRKRIGYLSATFPLGFLETQPGGFFQQFIDTWCQRVSPYHGYGGLGLIRSVSAGDAQRAERLLYPLIKRFPGLEIDMPYSHTLYCVEGIKGINWLTMLSEHFLQQLGGKEALQAQLDKEQFVFYDYPGGTMIQAGAFPQFGDLELNNVPKQYQTLYRLVRPLQTDKLHHIVAEVPEEVEVEGVTPEGFTQEWLRRFE